MTNDSGAEVYRLHVWIRQISPMIWRRLLVRSGSTIADLRRLYEVLKSQGLQMNQQVVFLSDGGDTVRDLQTHLSPESEHEGRPGFRFFFAEMSLTI